MLGFMFLLKGTYFIKLPLSLGDFNLSLIVENEMIQTFQECRYYYDLKYKQ